MFLFKIELGEKNAFTFWRCNLNQPTPSVFFQGPTIHQGFLSNIGHVGHFPGHPRGVGIHDGYINPWCLESLVTSNKPRKQTPKEAWRIMGKNVYPLLGKPPILGWGHSTWFQWWHGENCEKIETPSILLMKTIIFDNGANEFYSIL